MTRPLFAYAFDHHAWATIRLLDACAALTPEQLAADVPGTFGPIIATLRHLVAADASYLRLLSDGQVPAIDEESMGLADLRAAMERHRPVWAALVERDLDPGLVVIRRRADGSEGHAPLGIRLAQVLHHGTDHRSQVCTGLSGLGIGPPEIDAWSFGDSRGDLREVPAPAG